MGRQAYGVIADEWHVTVIRGLDVNNYLSRLTVRTAGTASVTQIVKDPVLAFILPYKRHISRTRHFGRYVRYYSYRTLSQRYSRRMSQVLTDTTSFEHRQLNNRDDDLPLV